MVCNNCDGYGFTIVPAGPLNLQLNDLIKPHPRLGTPPMTLDQAKAWIANTKTSIPGITDKNRYLQCGKCGGSGTGDGE